MYLETELSEMGVRSSAPRGSKYDNILTEEQFFAWGWRVPFLFSALLVLMGLWMRLKLTETPAFQKVLNSKKEAKVPFKQVITEHPKTLILGIVAGICTFVVFYLTTVFAMAWGTTKLGYSRNEFIIMELIATLFFALFIPLSAVMAEKFGRKNSSIFICVLAALFGLTFNPLLGSGNMMGVLLFLCFGMAIMGLTYGPIGTVLSEIFPTSVRYTGSALTFNFAGIFGAMAVAWLLKRFTAAGREVRPLMMELPSYHLPTVRNIGIGLWQRISIFVKRVGGIILFLTILLWFLASYPGAPEGVTGAAIEYSFAGMLGQALAVVRVVGWPQLGPRVAALEAGAADPPRPPGRRQVRDQAAVAVDGKARQRLVRRAARHGAEGDLAAQRVQGQGAGVLVA